MSNGMVNLALIHKIYPNINSNNQFNILNFEYNSYNLSFEEANRKIAVYSCFQKSSKLMLIFLNLLSSKLFNKSKF